MFGSRGEILVQDPSGTSEVQTDEWRQSRVFSLSLPKDIKLYQYLGFLSKSWPSHPPQKKNLSFKSENLHLYASYNNITTLVTLYQNVFVLIAIQRPSLHSILGHRHTAVTNRLIASDLDSLVNKKEDVMLTWVIVRLLKHINGNISGMFS